MFLILSFSFFFFFLKGTGKSFFIRQCLSSFEDLFNFPNCRRIYYVYNILSKEWMDSFKDLKCPPVEFVQGMNHPTMSLSNLKNIKESIFILDDVAHEDKDSKIRNFHTVMNHHNSNLR